MNTSLHNRQRVFTLCLLFLCSAFAVGLSTGWSKDPENVSAEEPDLSSAASNLLAGTMDFWRAGWGNSVSPDVVEWVDAPVVGNVSLTYDDADAGIRISGGSMEILQRTEVAPVTTTLDFPQPLAGTHGTAPFTLSLTWDRAVVLGAFTGPTSYQSYATGLQMAGEFSFIDANGIVATYDDGQPVHESWQVMAMMGVTTDAAAADLAFDAAVATLSEDDDCDNAIASGIAERWCPINMHTECAACTRRAMCEFGSNLVSIFTDPTKLGNTLHGCLEDAANGNCLIKRHCIEDCISKVRRSIVNSVAISTVHLFTQLIVCRSAAEPELPCVTEVPSASVIGPSPTPVGGETIPSQTVTQEIISRVWPGSGLIEASAIALFPEPAAGGGLSSTATGIFNSSAGSIQPHGGSTSPVIAVVLDANGLPQQGMASQFEEIGRRPVISIADTTSPWSANLRAKLDAGPWNNVKLYLTAGAVLGASGERTYVIGTLGEIVPDDPGQPTILVGSLSELAPDASSAETRMVQTADLLAMLLAGSPTDVTAPAMSASQGSLALAALRGQSVLPLGMEEYDPICFGAVAEDWAAKTINCVDKLATIIEKCLDWWAAGPEAFGLCVAARGIMNGTFKCWTDYFRTDLPRWREQLEICKRPAVPRVCSTPWHTVPGSTDIPAPILTPVIPTVEAEWTPSPEQICFCRLLTNPIVCAQYALDQPGSWQGRTAVYMCRHLGNLEDICQWLPGQGSGTPQPFPTHLSPQPTPCAP